MSVADEIRRAAIADIDNVLVERAHLRGRIERLEAVIRQCPKCTVRFQTPGPIDEGILAELAENHRRDRREDHR